ncbi:MAG: ATP-binding cassette domain-containing protein [Flavobacteriales bacterium]|nr:ATP-binding cassette domain-containing protein [Flavobacteriales bacterium]MDG2246187.1 ATP-binding cassette domain-containing protein [Flavobacteriales bacterium]
MESLESKITPTRRFWKLLKPDKREITNVYVYAIFNGLVTLSLPLGIQAIVNLIQGGQISTSWVILVTIVVLGVAASGILQIFQLRITENLQQKIFTRSAFEFAYRVPRIKMELLRTRHAPELMNRFFDTMSIQKGLSKILIDFTAAGLQVIFGLLLLSFYHPFFILFSVALVIIVYAIFKLTAGKGLDTSLTESKHKYRIAHWLEELARTSISFRLAGKTELPLHRTDAHVEDYLKARESHFKVLIQQYGMMVVFKVLVATGLLAIGGVLVMEQVMNIGQFVAAEIIILLVINSVEKLVQSLETIYDILTSLEKIGQVTDLELEDHSGIDLLSKCEGNGIDLCLKDINFSYPENKVKTLDQVSFDLKSGQSMTIMGEGSSGKSTLLHLIAGLYNAEEGAVSFNGFTIGNIETNSLRSVIGECLHSDELFQASILENITLGRPAVTFDNVQWAIESVGLGDFIRDQDEGYNTQIDPLGKRLPGRTAQRLLLARAIADRPKLLLLENPFELLGGDPILIDFFTNKEHGWTIISVSSNEYLAEKSDQVLLLKAGKIDRIGSYAEVKRHLPSK